MSGNTIAPVGRLRWKRNPKPTGLARVAAPPQGHTLLDAEGKAFAYVSPLGGGMTSLRGWYYTCPGNVSGEWINTCRTPAATAEEAKAQAIAFVKKHTKA